MEKQQCHLCKTNQASQTGSHIFSWSLIRSLVNKEGIKERENEVVFSFSESPFVETYIGRQQTAEDKVLPIKGRPLTEEEIRQSEEENPFTRDFILCPECEKKLSVLETIISERILVKLRKITVGNTGGYDLLTIQDGDLLRLFVYSLAWRGAVTKINDFEMQASNQESLRDVLHKCLDLDSAVLLKNIAENNPLIRNIALIVTFSEMKGRNNNYIYCSLSYKPYAMILNDLSFQLFFDDAPDDGYDPQFMGINDVIKKDELLMKDETEFKIGVLSDDIRKQINENLTTTLKNIILRPAVEDFSIGFQRAIKRKPIQKEVELFIKNVLKRGNHKIENYTSDDFRQAAAETLIQLFPGRFLI